MDDTYSPQGAQGITQETEYRSKEKGRGGGPWTAFSGQLSAISVQRTRNKFSPRRTTRGFNHGTHGLRGAATPRDGRYVFTTKGTKVHEGDEDGRREFDDSTRRTEDTKNCNTPQKLGAS